MRKGIDRALLAAAVLVPTLSMAQEGTRPSEPEFSYSYVEIGYDEIDFDVPAVGGIDGDGLTVSGSYELTDEWHIFAAYGTNDLDFDIDLDTLAIGAGYVFPLNQDVDIYGRVLYIDQEVDVPGFGDVGDDGLGLQGRIRARMTPELELEGGVQYIDVGDSDTSLQVAARYHFTEVFSAGIGLTFGGDADAIGVNARFQF
jgi:outer membrane protein with beta-barrel domain